MHMCVNYLRRMDLFYKMLWIRIMAFGHSITKVFSLNRDREERERRRERERQREREGGEGERGGNKQLKIELLFLLSSGNDGF